MRVMCLGFHRGSASTSRADPHPKLQIYAKRENNHAMDHRNYISSPMGARLGYFGHAGGIHSCGIRGSDKSCCRSVPKEETRSFHGPQSCRKEQSSKLTAADQR